MAGFEVIEKESLRLVKVTLQNETVRTESGAMYTISVATFRCNLKPLQQAGF